MFCSRVASLVSRSSVRALSTGIHKLDIHVPLTYVRQSDLEKFDGVAPGKYTNGLGLRNMAFCDDNEDMYSMFLTALDRFLRKNGLQPRDIGRLEVGTETVLDKSKAAKTVLMELFTKTGHSDMEGVDNMNACYGGTAALLNTVAWADSPAADGRYGIVICGDIATYEPGPARPTGGAAVAVMLIGRDAPLQLEGPLRGSHFEHAYDFYKPKMESEWPVVDGHHSIDCYMRALDQCYSNYVARFERFHGRPFSLHDDADRFLFHSPFVKMARKALSRLALLEAHRNPSKFSPAFAVLAAAVMKSSTTSSSSGESSSTSNNKNNNKNNNNDAAAPPSAKEVEAAASKACSEMYDAKVASTTRFSEEIGNSYTASLYTSLASTLIDSDCAEKRLMMFSYGSGLAATLFSLLATKQVGSVVDKQELNARLSGRVPMPPEHFTEAQARRQKKAAVPLSGTENLAPGSFYLKNIDDKYRRFYGQV